ncbi:hypothetical protein [Streptomyces sp. NPDC053427]|uniref:hypothetical protein n=1 Tax=Streptomyces sp. NPDC053427 TaxID=3365701 RepID=UPI0037D426A6
MSAAILADAERMESEAQALYASLYGAPPEGTHDAHRWRCDTLDRIDELREAARSIKARIESSREHIRNYYGLDLRIDLKVKHEGHSGRIVGFAGQYVEVAFDGDDHSTTCHATSGMEYPPQTRIGPDPDERFAHLVKV